MGTHRITTLQLNGDPLTTDLERAASFRYSESYSEFVCGAWRSCALWNRSGDLSDTRLEDYDGAARVTGHGEQLPFLVALVTRSFDVRSLKYARLARLTPGSVLVPHRDYLELDADLTRIHIPLQTDPSCYSSEENTIYQMRRGEVWFLDATRTHSAASFATTDRVHLILDFAVDDPDSTVRIPIAPTESIPEDSVVPRRPVLPRERASFQALANIIDADNYREILAMVIKRYFVADLAVEDVFRWLTDIAAASGREDVLAKIRSQEEHCLVHR